MLVFLCKNMSAIRILILLLVIQSSHSLRNVYLEVPEAAERGSKVEMKCHYDLEQMELYCVKWYRGDREFCRYAPKEVPPLKVFRIPGIEVDRDNTDATRLTMEPATQIAEGKYTCEVSADAPSFQTAQVHSHMYVVVLPKEGPVMHGLKRRYRPGMKLKVECMSGDSLPAANLSFFINNEPALSQHVLHRVDGNNPEGLMSAYSTIQFTVQKHHFLRGKIKIRCTAFIYMIYVKSLEKCADAERMPATAASIPEVKDSIIYSVHRLPEKSNTSSAVRVETSSRLFTLILLILPTVLR